MRYGIPLLGDRVAPRCRCADGILIVIEGRGRGTSQRWLPLRITDPQDLIAVLKSHRVDTVVCGGISREEREAVISWAPRVIDNVACTAGEAVAALEAGSLRSGFGLTTKDETTPDGADAADLPLPPSAVESVTEVDCLHCRDKGCLRGERCSPPALAESAQPPSAPVAKILEAATDISTEEERQLCRLAELVYFCFEMDYHRIGIAYCVDLQEPAAILAGVLDRSFQTVGICCKIGTLPRSTALTGAQQNARAEFVPPVSCNPLAQAHLLNRARTDLNVAVGLCMGADCVFTQASEAPVTTLFVKDKSLANNPIGAVYSEYYLRESVSTTLPAQESSSQVSVPEREDRS
jgi:uncharacterized metal-binding protein